MSDRSGKPCASRQQARVRQTRFDTSGDLAGSVVPRATVASVRPNIEAGSMTLGPFEAGSLLAGDPRSRPSPGVGRSRWRAGRVLPLARRSVVLADSLRRCASAETGVARLRGAVPLPRQFRDRKSRLSEPRLGAPAWWECGCGSGRCYLWAQKRTERLFFEHCSARIGPSCRLNRAARSLAARSPCCPGGEARLKKD